MSLLPSIANATATSGGGDVKSKIENIKKEMYLHPLKNRTPNVLAKDRKDKNDAEEEDEGEDSPQAQLQHLIESKNLNPAQLKKDFYAGTLNLLDPENCENIQVILRRDRVPNYKTLV